MKILYREKINKINILSQWVKKKEGQVWMEWVTCDNDGGDVSGVNDAENTECQSNCIVNNFVKHGS